MGVIKAQDRAFSRITSLINVEARVGLMADLEVAAKSLTPDRLVRSLLG